MANFIYKMGDMFETPADAIVNTVNCVGIMGKGVASEFKSRWIYNFKQYKKACDNKTIVTGKMFVVENENYKPMLGETDDYQYLINFPTKKHWRSKSKTDYINDGLDDLVQKIQEYNIKSIVIPPLGCGNGQLDWMDIKPLIKQKLSALDNSVDVILYEPKYEVASPEHTQSLEMTKLRAILFRTLQHLELPFGCVFTPLCLQKTIYFLEQMGYDYKANFSKNRYGPYSESITKAFECMEKKGYLNDFSEGQVTVSFRAIAYADQFIKNNKITDEVENTVEKISLLFDGYEGPFGLELLSTVHYCYTENPTANIVESVHAWSDRKQEMFTPPMIESALHRLKQDKIIH